MDAPGDEQTDQFEAQGLDDLPFAGFGRSWYQVAWSHELENGQLKRVRYFNLDLVVFRGESGAVGVIEAYCGHLGANLGVGGRIVDDDIVCPFHEWRWDSQGRNVDIPYSRRSCNRSVRIRSFPVEERDGLILIWYEEDGKPPDWTPQSLPEFCSDDYYPVVPHGVLKCWPKVRLQPQHVIENSADFAHLKYVHKNAEVATVSRHEPDGHVFKFSFSTLYLTPDWGEVSGEIPGTWTGVGILNFEIRGVHDAAQYLTVTPVDRTTSDMRITVVAERVPGAESPNGTLAARIMHHQVKEVERDLPIWENMRYAVKPTLAVEEVRPFRRLRDWSYQFYPMVT